MLRAARFAVSLVLVVAAIAVGASPASAQEGAAPREIVTPEEQAELDRVARLEAQPVLECEPGELRAEAERGEEALLTLTIRNAGGRKLEWSVFSKPAWVRVDAERGELGHGEDRKLLVAVDTTGLAPGTAKGRLVVVAADAKGSPATVA